MLKYIFLCLVFLTLFACSNQPLYSPAKSADYTGYYETRLTETRYRVTFTGYANTSSEKVKNFALLRAAELTTENGYDWFKIIDQEQEGKLPERHNPKVSVVIGTGVGRCYPFGCRVVGGPFYTGVIARTEAYDTHQKSIIEILMGKGEPDEPTAVYDAKELIKFLSVESVDKVN